MDNDKQFMTLAGYAASRNLSPQYVGRLRTAGIVIVAANGKVDAAASDRMRSQKIRARMPVTPRQKHGRDSYLEARTRREIVAAEREQVLLDQLRGRLVDSDLVLAAATSAFRNCRQRLRGLARSLPPLLQGRSLSEIQQILEQAIDAALETLSVDVLSGTNASRETGDLQPSPVM